MQPRSSCKGLTAVLLIISGIILLCLRTLIFDSILTWAFVLRPSSPLVDFWLEPTVTATTSIYLFNWTNPEEIYNTTSKPKFQEVGPYVFTIKTKKVNVTWNANNTVTFSLLQTYYFDETKSAGKLTDQITTLNTVTMGGAHRIKDSDYFTKKGFSFSLGLLAPHIHITKSASELLFDGYNDPYVDLTRTFFGEAYSPVDKVGYFYGRNVSYKIDGVYNVATGGADEHAGEILSWNYDNELSREGTCKKLHGSMGDFFRREDSRKSIEMFIAYVCRNLQLDYEQDVAVNSIDGYKYSAQHSLLDNGTLIPENKCWCDGQCIPSGVLNISACSHGAPSFLSLPHFYRADPVYLSLLDGLHPDKSKHEFYLTVEPRIGFCLDLALRIQANYLLHPVEYIRLYEDVPTVYFPLLWCEQIATVPVELAALIMILLSLPNIILPVIAVILILVGVLVLLRIIKANDRIMWIKIPQKEQIRDAFLLNRKESVPTFTLRKMSGEA